MVFSGEIKFSNGQLPRFPNKLSIEVFSCDPQVVSTTCFFYVYPYRVNTDGVICLSGFNKFRAYYSNSVSFFLVSGSNIPVSVIMLLPLCVIKVNFFVCFTKATPSFLH